MSAEWEKFVQDVMERVDLAEFIGRYTRLRKSGSRFMGLCPLHGDNDPSMSISPDVGLWHCFGCKKGGNIFTFIMEKESMTFLEAAQLLSDQYRIELPSFKDEKAEVTPKRALLDMHQIAEKFFADFIRSSRAQPFRDYLKKRNIPKSVVEKFNIGASPDSWDSLTNLLRKKKYTDDLIIKSGLAVHSDKGTIYDRFRNRLMIPIKDNLSRTVGFGGRVLDKSEPKYINSPESAIFQKSEILFAFPFARETIRKSGFVIIMEGYTDVMRAHQMGIENAVASMGTALTPKHIKKLKDLAKRIILAFDGDAAGIAAAVRSAEELIRISEIQTRVVIFDEGLDPEEFISKKGKDEFVKRLKKAKTGIDFLIGTVMPHETPKHYDEKITILNNILNYVLLIPDDQEQLRLIKQDITVKLEMDDIQAMQIYSKRKKGIKTEPVSDDELSHAAKSDDEPDIREKEIIKYLVYFASMRKAAKLHLKPSEFKYPVYRKFAALLFDPDFPINTSELQKLPEIYENEDFMNLVSELMNSYDKSKKYCLEDFSEMVSQFKMSAIDTIRKRNRNMILEAQKEGDDAKISKLQKDNQELARISKEYKEGFMIYIED
jgi:DNA primase